MKKPQGTVTGRFSSRDPVQGSQPTSQKVREPVDSTLVAIDFTEIEQRVLAHMQGCDQVWMNKRPPEHFFGPDDYVQGMVVVDEMTATAQRIERWYIQYYKLSLWDRIRLFWSFNGCFVNVPRT